MELNKENTLSKIADSKCLNIYCFCITKDCLLLDDCEPCVGEPGDTVIMNYFPTLDL